MPKDSEVERDSGDVLFLSLETKLRSLKWLGVTFMPEHQSYMEESLLICWTLGPKCLKELGQLGLLTRIIAFGLSLWLRISIACIPRSNILWESNQRMCHVFWFSRPFLENQNKLHSLFWPSSINYMAPLLLNSIIGLIYSKSLRLTKNSIFLFLHST